MTLYQKFKKLNIDFSAIGLEQRGTEEKYFCTPKGARIIGWAGVDGIHYCFIRGFEEMVFAVSPMNTPGDYVRPIARSFEDLLRLLLACGSMDAIEQTHLWDEGQFDEYVAENQPTTAALAVFDVLRDKLGITPMEHPYGYIRKLQQSFDYGQIQYPPEYYDIDMNPAAEPVKPEWKVTYDGGFWDNCGRAGKEIPVGKTFSWGDEVWYLPAVYACGKGLVVDFCVEVAPERVKAFIDKWDLEHENERHFSKDEREQISREHPLNIEFRPSVEVNGKLLRSKHGCGVSWIAPSCLQEDMCVEIEAETVLDHYGLDASRCWNFHRCTFPWATSRKPAIKSLELHLERSLTDIPGIRFQTPAAGESISFTHPVTGVKHTLTVQEYEAQEMDPACFPDQEMEYPTHYAAMTYTLDPDIPGDSYMLQDCADGDHPRQKQTASNGPTSVCSAAVIGIIGGADGQTAIILSSRATAKLHAVCSSLHFEPVQNVEWRFVFRQKLMQDVDVKLI